MPRICTSVAPQPGHLRARNSSIPRNRLPVFTNSEAGMTLGQSAGFDLKTSVMPVPDGLRCRASVEPPVSLSRYGSLMPPGASCRGVGQEKQLTSYNGLRSIAFSGLFCALLELVVSASCAVNTCASEEVSTARDAATTSPSEAQNTPDKQSKPCPL